MCARAMDHPHQTVRSATMKAAVCLRNLSVNCARRYIAVRFGLRDLEPDRFVSFGNECEDTWEHDHRRDSAAFSSGTHVKDRYQDPACLLSDRSDRDLIAA